MKRKWTLVKDFIAGREKQNELFLTILDGEGSILSANSLMKRSLQILHPRVFRTNFFSLLHAKNLEAFRSAMEFCDETGRTASAELYLKNGRYHPMKWELIPLDSSNSRKKNYLCAGYKLADEARLEKFNKLASQHCQLIMEGLSEGILLQDVNAEVIMATQRAAEILGTTLQRMYSTADIRQSWNCEWMIEDEAGKRMPFSDSPFQLALTSRRLCSKRLNVRMKNGEYRRIRITAQPLLDEHSSEVRAVVSAFTDVSEEQELAMQLQNKERLFRVFLDNSPNLVWVVDEDAHLKMASKSFYKYFKLDEKSSEGKKVSDLVPAKVFNALFEKHLRVLEKGQPAAVTEKVTWADGSRFAFHISIFCLEGTDGKKLLGGHAVNVAEKYAAEKQLREANDRLLLLSRASANAIWEWDMQTGYIFRNDAMMDMIGYQQEDTKGLTWWFRRIHPEDRNRVGDKLKERTDRGELSWDDEYRFKCADGTYKHMLDKGYIVYENGLPVRMIGSLQDVTGLKELENELVREKLDHQRNISETVIRVQEKERTRIGHELHDNVNQLLSTTKLFVDLLSPSSEEEKMIKEKSTTYLLQAIEEIRKLSRELVTPQLKNNTLVESIQQLIDDISVSTALQVRFTYDHDIELLSSGQKVTLFRIVQEQMKNILKYSNARNTDILLICRDGEVRLTIRDNGVGFNTEQPVKGIGLTNIQERARFYNGEVAILSSPGKGCTLQVYLPFDESSAPSIRETG